MNGVTYWGVQGEDTAHGYALVKKAINFHFPYTIRKLFFRTNSRPELGPIQLPTKRVSWSFIGVDRPRRGVEHPPPLSAKVKERVELYIYSPFMGLRGLLQSEIYP